MKSNHSDADLNPEITSDNTWDESQLVPAPSWDEPEQPHGRRAEDRLDEAAADIDADSSVESASVDWDALADDVSADAQLSEVEPESEVGATEATIFAPPAEDDDADASSVGTSSKLDKKEAKKRAKADKAEAKRVAAAKKVDGSQRRKGRRVGGIAPMVKPPGRFARMRAARRWSRRGFVPRGPRQEKRRHRILPRTVIGISGMLMALGIGAAFAGAAFYAYYDDRLAENEREVARFVDGFDQQFTDASSAIDQLRVQSVEEIRGELAPLGEFVTEQNGVIELPALAGPSVWTISTLDEAGRPISGSAFAVTGHEGGTALVTSYSLVRASTGAPGPEITLIKNGERVEATLWSWDPSRDLALVVTPAEIPTLDLAVGTDQIDALGARVFAMSGIGGQGATASPGVLIDQSDVGVQHTAAIGEAFLGGPLLDGSGLVIGVTTLDYEPFGIENGQVSFAPDVSGICARVLRCADGTVPTVGESGTG